MRPKDFTAAEVDELINAKNYLFAQKPFPLKILSEKIQKILNKTEWVNGSDLIDSLTKLTSSKNLAGAEKVLVGWKREVAEKPPESTVPQNREDLEKERVLREEQEKVAKEKAEKDVKEFIARHQKSADQRAEIQKALKDKAVYLEPKDKTQKIELTRDEKEAVIKLAKSATDDPKNFVNKLSDEIIKNLPEEIKSRIPEGELKTSTQLVSLDLAKRLTSNSPVAPTGIFAAVADPKTNLNQFVSSASALEEARVAAITWTAISNSSDITTRTLLYPLLGQKVVSFIYGIEGREYVATQSQTPNTTHTIHLENLTEGFNGFLNNPLFGYVTGNFTDEAKAKVINWGSEYLASQFKEMPQRGIFGFLSRSAASGELSQGLSLLFGSQSQYAITTTSLLGKTLFTLFPEYAPLAGSILGHFGIDLGITISSTLAPAVAGAAEVGAGAVGAIATEAAIGGAVGATATVAGTAAVATGGAAAGTSAGAAAGLLTGPFAPIAVPLLALLGALLGKLLGKLLQPILNWLKKHQEDLKIVGLIMLGGGAVLRSIPMFVFGGLIFIPTALKTGFSMAGAAARTFWLFGRLGRSMAITIGTPIIVAIIVFPILVALILFIINSGAYIVPPQGGYTRGTISCSQAIADRAKAIVDNLQPGFWGYFNKSPDYPELFDDALFAQNPDLVGIDTHKVFVNMFWCTWLVVKSYSENGYPVSDDLLFMTNLVNFFRGEGHYIDAAAITIQDVCPGMAVFFNVAGSSSPNHVGIVYSVSPDGFTTVESNAPWKTMFYPADSSGHFQIVGSGSGTIEVSGFGTP